MPTIRSPGVYREFIVPDARAELPTGVPVFLGYTRQQGIGQQNARSTGKGQKLRLWPQFEQYFGESINNSYLAYAVRGFFENGGQACHIVPLDPALDMEIAMRKGLEAAELLTDADLVCAPDIMRPRALYSDQTIGLPPDSQAVTRIQNAILDHCDRLGDRLAILDTMPVAEGSANLDSALQHRRKLKGSNGALYHPWVKIANGPSSPPWLRVDTVPKMISGFVPPCGHIAGVYSRNDRQVGFHKAPANERLEAVLDLEVNLTDLGQGPLNAEGVNCLRVFGGRGIRIWGARTLSRDPLLRYVNMRRVMLTVHRWIENNLTGIVFEHNDTWLWARIIRQLSGYLGDLYQKGALKGRTPQEAFFVKCDAETNPPEERERGSVIAEVGLAPAVPSEFVIVSIALGDNGITISGSSGPA